MLRIALIIVGWGESGSHTLLFNGRYGVENCSTYCSRKERSKFCICCFLSHHRIIILNPTFSLLFTGRYEVENCSTYCGRKERSKFNIFCFSPIMRLLSYM
ncbi:hypothetical protein OIU78_022193 [Salix suchowensis]|nr:hypothetical protein OIU78_022193 [Salix suchowensis]